MANILVVDDDSLTLDLLTIVLQRHGYLFSSATDGAEALKLCESQKFDLIITDIFMPNVDGIDLMVALNERNFRTPIIVMSGGNGETFDLARVCGVHSTIKKPFTENSILGAVRSALRD